MIRDGMWWPDLTSKGYEAFNCYTRYLLVSGPRKCVAPNTLVWTPSGMVRAESLNPGAEVLAFDHDSELIPCRVVATHKIQFGPAIRLENDFGYDITVSPDHPIWCCVDGDEPSFIWLLANEIERLVETGVKVWSPVMSPQREKDASAKTYPDDIEAWWLGAMAGDGSCKTRNPDGSRRSIAFHNNDFEVIDLCRKFVESKGGSFTRYAKYTYGISKARCLHDLLEEHQLSCTSDHKRIPEKIMTGSLERLRSFLMGIYDTDGTACKRGRLSIILSSKAFVLDIQRSLLRFGVASVYRQKVCRCTNAPQPHSSTYYSLEIYGADARRFVSEIGLVCSKKRDRVNLWMTQDRGRVQRGLPGCFPKLFKIVRDRHFSALRKSGWKSTRAFYRKNRFLHSFTKYCPSRTALLSSLDVVDEPELRKFLVSERWAEWVSATRCETELYDIAVDESNTFIAEGIPNHNCAKTRSLVHKVLRHAYENPGAVCAVLAKTTRVAKASGVWSDLVDWATPQWTSSGIGFKVLKAPASTDYKLTYYKVSSHTGQSSEIQLHSLDHASQVEEKFKGQAFSFIYVSEADQFLDEKAFNRLADQLRGIVPYDRAQMILDCNPPEDGQDSWLWDVFETRAAKLRAAGSPMADLYKHIRVPLSDNHFLDPREKEELIARYSNDPFDFKRYVLGEWVRDKSRTHFGEALTPAHVLGDVSSGDKAQWQILVPSKASYELFTGWDLGDNNHGVVFAAKRTVGDKVAFDVFDEIEVVGREVSIQDVTEAAAERIEYWEKYMKDEYVIETVRWRHWSDNSVKRYRAAADSHDELLVRDYSRGKINLVSVVKGGGSVRQRVNLLKRLLNERLIYFSANLPAVLRMLKELPKGPSQAEVVPRDDPRKHIFDALTYMLISESPMALEDKQKPTVRPTPIIISRR